MSLGKRILIVDDDAFIRRPLELILREEGYDPATAVDAEDGRRQIEDLLPDLIFLDIMMPGMDGFTLCAELRRDARTAGIPIVLLSAKGRDHDRERGLAAGATEFMTKPYSPHQLKLRVRELLAGR